MPQQKSLRLDAFANTLHQKRVIQPTAHRYLSDKKRDSKIVIASLKSKEKNIKHRKEMHTVSQLLMGFYGQEKLNAKIL